MARARSQNIKKQYLMNTLYFMILSAFILKSESKTLKIPTFSVKNAEIIRRKAETIPEEKPEYFKFYSQST